MNQVGTDNAATATTTTTSSTTPTVNSSTTPDPIMEAGKKVLMAGLSQGGNAPLTHAQELTKYGKIMQGFSVIISAAFGKGTSIEYGTVATNKGWVQAYRTVYKTYTILQGSGSINYFNISSSKSGYSPTFSDWAGPVTETGGNLAFISGSYGTAATYSTWSIGAGPGVPDVMGSVNYGTTTLLGEPYYEGPIQQNTGPISNWYINGGYNQ